MAGAFVQMCLQVCMYALGVHVYMGTCVYTCVPRPKGGTCMSVPVFMCFGTYAYLGTCMHICMCVYESVCAGTCMLASTCVYMGTSVYSMHVYASALYV